MKINLRKITKRGKALFLAYDQGLEHGPTSDFNDRNVDSLYVLDIAKKGGFQGIVFQKGIAEMFETFEKIEREAHAKGIPVIAWIYPRGKSVKNDVSREMISYAARTGLELGADIVKLKYGGNPKDLAWAVKSAGRTKIVVAGGTKKGEKEFLRQVRDIMKTGTVGLAIGRNIWQHKKPLEITRKIKKIVFAK